MFAPGRCLLSLQERVLEVLGKQSAVPAKEIGGLFPDVERVALDCCLNALLQRNAVILAAGNYSAVRVPGEKPAPIRVTAPALEAITASAAPVEPRTRRCRECREPKPLSDYPEIGPQKRRGKTCNACREMLVQKKQQPVIADRVFEIVKARRQAALNRATVLKVDLGNAEAEIAECDQFLAMYERFAESAS